MAVRLATSSFAGFLAAAWGAERQLTVEASLSAVFNNVFTVEPALEATSLSQQQQVGFAFSSCHSVYILCKLNIFALSPT